MSEKSIVKEKYISYLNNIICNNKVSHAYIIEVDDYNLDMKYIYDFVKMILCSSKYEDIESSENNIIKLIDNNNYPDIRVISPEGTNIKKNQLLELQKDYKNTSLLDNKRIYIIKEAEKLNLSSANTILKFLEEPEDNIIALLLTDNRYHIIDTILSRCQILTLKENSFVGENDESFFEFFKAIIDSNSFFIKYNFFINNYVVDKTIMKEKLFLVENIIVDYLNNRYMNSEKNDEITCFLNGYSEKKLLNILSILENEIPKLEYNINYKMWIDSLISKLVLGG